MARSGVHLLAALATMGAALAAGGPSLVHSAVAAGPQTLGCRTPLFDEPTRAAVARVESPAAYRASLERSSSALTRSAAADDDPTLWLGVCGDPFFREPEPVGPRVRPASLPETSLPEDVNVLDLSSRPRSKRVIYLDFTGHTASGTSWNDDYGKRRIVARPFSLDRDRTTDFSPAEREQVQQAWETVAEDYAPFDVNVTTRDPGAAAIHRDSRADQRFGTRAVMSGAGLGSIAYLDVFDAVGRQHANHQPAWVDGYGIVDGWELGQIASHEVGHNLDLLHDGTRRDDYHPGRQHWGPIMGAPYDTTLTQWSKGEYVGATDRRDDLAVIAASGLSRRSDDHGNSSVDSTPLRGSTVQQATGIVSTRADVDAFRFVAPAGRIRLAVTPTATNTDVDLRLRIIDRSGATVAAASPPAARYDIDARYLPSPAWLAAEWEGDITTGETYTVFVDGVGDGDEEGPGWSDYGSLGAYRVVVSSPSR